MPEGSEYRFLPWARRGLVAEVAEPDPGGVGPLPIRAGVHVDVTIINAGTGGVDLAVLGPGDVIGIDPRILVRTEPRLNSTNFEPNYLAAIEFDPPDFPWMFTPARPGGERLRPWVVLVVVERKPGVSIAVQPGAPLPVLQIKSPASAREELPDLADAWMWAHGQVLMEQGSVTPIPEELAAAPNRNVSRLVCPRRLRPGAQYAACLVPAFAAGRDRGLGIGADAAATTTGMAWAADQAEVRLPVYYHWDFATGPSGDFESLAAQLHPFACPPTVGYVKMHVGAAGPGIALPYNAPERFMDMDGALRAPSGVDGSLDEAPEALCDDLGVVLDAAAKHAGGQDGPTVPAVGPPIYGQWHAARHTVPADGEPPTWLRQLNLDPRTRVSAGLGAEVVRRNQEDFAQMAWEQVGRVLEANRLLNTARLALEAARRTHARHVSTLPDRRRFQLAAPLHARVKLGDVTVRAAIHPTSLPDAATDPALRRLASPQRAMLKGVARRAGGRAFEPRLVETLAAGTPAVDPTVFVPDGVIGLTQLGRLEAPAAGDAAVSLRPLGVEGSIPAARLRTVREQIARAGKALGSGRMRITPRANLPATGLVSRAQLGALEGLVSSDPGALHEAVGRLVEANAAQRGAAALLASRDEGGALHLDALDVDAGGEITVRTPGDRPNVLVGRMDPHLATGREGARGVLAGLPPGTFDRRGRALVTLRTGPTRKPIVSGGPGQPSPIPAPVPGHPATNTIPMLERDAAAITRFEEAFNATLSVAELEVPPVTRELVAFDLAGASREIALCTDPDRTVRARVSSMIRVAGVDLVTALGPAVAPTFDRVMAYPEFDVATYRYLADYDEQRLCPGIEVVPPDSVTLLETNPRFVEAFLVGLNHEMNRELLWRAYPCDLRGTPFRRFWDRTDGALDIEPIHTFAPGLGVGRHLVDAKPKLVLLLRGQLLRRYPTAVVYAVRAVRVAGRQKMSTAPGDVRAPIFHGWFDPDVTFYGFPLEDTDLGQGEGWFFVLQQQPTEPRFGLDETISRVGEQPTTWNDAAWPDTGIEPDHHLTFAALSGIATLPDPGDAGAVAAALFQRPMRVAVHAKHLVGA